LHPCGIRRRKQGMNSVYSLHQDRQTVYMIENHREVRKAYVVRREGGFTVIELMDGSLIRLRNSRLFASKESADKELDRWRSRNIRMMDPETIWSAGSRSLSLRERLGPYAYPH
jgi:hypothetical protein